MQNTQKLFKSYKWHINNVHITNKKQGKDLQGVPQPMIAALLQPQEEEQGVPQPMIAALLQHQEEEQGVPQPMIAALLQHQEEEQGVP